MAEINGVGRVGIRNYVAPLPTIWNNLTHYYSGDNTANDLKGTSNGTLINGTTYGAGKINNGFDFDGINDYISFPVNTFKPIGDFSISFWFYKKNNNQAGYMSFTEIGQPYYGNGMFGYNYNGGFAFEVNGGRDIVTPFIPNDTWTHIVITHKDSTNYKIYTNGVLATPVPGNYPNTATTTVNPNFSSNNIAMAINNVGGYVGATKFDEIALFDGAELTQSQITELYNSGEGKQYVVPAPTYTSRTTAFATATGITDTTILNALNTFDTGLISNGLDTKMKALYPFVGGTANTHKYNFMDARDSDAAFRLVFSGGITHDTNGALGNGVNGSGNTFLNPFTTLTNSNLHLSWYSRTASTVGVYSSEMTPDMAYGVGSNWVTIRVNNKAPGYACFAAGNDGGGSTVGASITNNGFFLGSETSSNLRKIYKNGTLSATNTVTDTTSLSNVNLNFWGGTSQNYSANNCAFASIGSGLTDGEATTLYNLVQAMQTSLSRAV